MQLKTVHVMTSHRT